MKVTKSILKFGFRNLVSRTKISQKLGTIRWQGIRVMSLAIVHVCMLLLLIPEAAGQAHSGHTIAPTGTEQHPAAVEPKGGSGKKQKKAEGQTSVTISLSEEKRQLIGVRTAVASYRRLDRQVRTVGRVEIDETRLAFVNAKISGWVRKLYVDYTGKKVKKGEPLFSIYSPELVSAQEEYILALKSSRSLTPSGYGEVRESQDSLLESARRRLLLWDITSDQISKLERSGLPKTEMEILSPIDGIVIEKMVFEGGYIMPGMNLYKIADLSSIWIIADIYEYEAPLVRPGQKARVSISYFPGETFDAAVSYVYPTLDPMTRTIKVRLEVNNTDFRLKPEMFADVVIMASPGERLAIPKEAVIDSGLRQLVYVEKKPGIFEMREVRLGLRGETYVEVLSGVKKGERVVTSGNFLIDSETQLRAGPGGGHVH